MAGVEQVILPTASGLSPDVILDPLHPEIQRTVLISREQIQGRVRQLAEEIAPLYQNQRLLLVGVLTGAVPFTVDLMRELYAQGLTDVEIDFMRVSSYGQSDQPEEVKEGLGLKSEINGRHVLLVEDIVDTGHSLETELEILNLACPASLRSVALLDKPERRQVAIEADWIGFRIPDYWVEGYGLDTNEVGRAFPDIRYRL